MVELTEEQRNELMKKESSRLQKTGHRVTYSPRKEKALKIYLDGAPNKDLTQDWYLFQHFPWGFFLLSERDSLLRCMLFWQQDIRCKAKPVSSDWAAVLPIRSSVVPSQSSHCWIWNHVVHYIVKCTVMRKGMCKSIDQAWGRVRRNWGRQQQPQAHT